MTDAFKVTMTEKAINVSLKLLMIHVFNDILFSIIENSIKSYNYLKLQLFKATIIKN